MTNENNKKIVKNEVVNIDEVHSKSDMLIENTKAFVPKFENVREFLKSTYPRINEICNNKNDKALINLITKELINVIEYLGFTVKQNIRNQRTLTIKDNTITYFDDNIEAKFDSDLEEVLMNFNIKYSKLNFDKAIKVMMADNTHCPFIEKLKSLKWDGVERLNSNTLNKYFKDTDEVAGDYIKAFMIATIGRVNDGYFQSPVFIMGGEQGIGKSYFTKWLSKPFGLGGHAERHINPDNKDDLAICCETMIIEIAESINTFKRDREVLKKHFTAGYFYFRNPYAKYNIQRPHCASYIATANLAGLGILKDPTGNRRFIICEMIDIDKSYSKELDIEQLWAEANYIYKSKKDELNSNYELLIDVAKRDFINSRYASRPIEYDDLEELIEYTGDDYDRIKPKVVIDALLQKTNNKDRNILKAIVFEYLLENYNVKQEKAKLGESNTNVFKRIKLK